MDAARPHADLSVHEARVLGCLVEKEATTPDAYPLTANSLRNACNQSTSRNPVLELSDHDVEAALASLRERGLTRTVHSTSNRATKYRHVLPEALGLEAGETALIAVLMLRGEQTVGELKGRTERQHAFGSVDEAASTLEALAARDEPLVRQLERRPGQKDARWVELLSTTAVEGSSSAAAPVDAAPAAAESISTGDPYSSATAEFYDLLATEHWETFGLQLLDLLDGVDPGAGPIVDVGAGTGVALPYLRAAAPEATIHAIEPSGAMRTALHTRLRLDDELRAVTTVDPRSWASARLPPTACAIVATAVLGHFDRDDRDRLWRFVAERMPTGAPAVIELLPPERPTEIPRTRYRELRVGRYVYEGWMTGEPTDAATMRWTMEYRVVDGEVVVAEHTVVGTWTCVSVADIRSEIESRGLELTEHDDHIVVRRTG